MAEIFGLNDVPVFPARYNVAQSKRDRQSSMTVVSRLNNLVLEAKLPLLHLRHGLTLLKQVKEHYLVKLLWSMFVGI